MLHRNNATRWNTGYSMLQSMIRNGDAVDVFGPRHPEQLDEDRLSVVDWEQLADAVSILQPFHYATLCMESDFSGLDNILVELDFLRATFTSVLQKYHANLHLHIRRASREGIVILDEYWQWYNELSACVAAEVLHPAYKLEYFMVVVDKLEWTEQQLQDVKPRVQGLWLTKYMPVS